MTCIVKHPLYSQSVQQSFYADALRKIGHFSPAALIMNDTLVEACKTCIVIIGRHVLVTEYVLSALVAKGFEDFWVLFCFTVMFTAAETELSMLE